MKKSTKYILLSATLLGLGVASYFIFRNDGEDMGKNPNEELSEDEQVETGQDEGAIVTGDTITPLGDYANIRSSMEVENGFFNNKVRTVSSPNPIGVVLEVNTIGLYNWYKVDMSDISVTEGNTMWNYDTLGYVRGDVVTKYI